MKYESQEGTHGCPVHTILSQSCPSQVNLSWAPDSLAKRRPASPRTLGKGKEARVAEPTVRES